MNVKQYQYNQTASTYCYVVLSVWICGSEHMSRSMYNKCNQTRSALQSVPLPGIQWSRDLLLKTDSAGFCNL